MAFFSKLKDRLFKSSSRLEKGLDAIVEDGGEEEAVAPVAATTAALGATSADLRTSAWRALSSIQLDRHGLAAWVTCAPFFCFVAIRWWR